MQQYLKIFKALSDKTRLRIVLMLRVKPMCVCEIREVIGSSMSTVSNHLKIIKEASLISSSKEDRYIIYKLEKNNRLQEILMTMLDQLEDEQVIADIKKASKISRKDII